MTKEKPVYMILHNYASEHYYTYSDVGSRHFVDAMHVREKFWPMTIMILSRQNQSNQ